MRYLTIMYTTHDYTGPMRSSPTVTSSSKTHLTCPQNNLGKHVDVSDSASESLEIGSTLTIIWLLDSRICESHNA